MGSTSSKSSEWTVVTNYVKNYVDYDDFDDFDDFDGPQVSYVVSQVLVRPFSPSIPFRPMFLVPGESPEDENDPDVFAETYAKADKVARARFKRLAPGSKLTVMMSDVL